MKFRKLVLKNIASIYVGMGLKEIQIDFTKCKNLITLLIGPNGTGKTSILSFLHPFAYPGNMDVRNGSDIILQNEDGYKEVVIDDGEDEYIIKHYYLNKTNRIIKSFMMKNGVEMNPNGNVTSFMELIKLHLGLEPDFLKLLRLGSNVTSFINMKYTDRKKFTSQLLSDVDTYTMFYKKINDDVRLMKTLIKSSSHKLSKLNISNLNVEENHLHDLENQLIELQNNRDRIIVRKGNIEFEISKLIKIEELKLRIHDVLNKIKDTEKIIYKYQKETPYTVKELKDSISNLQDKIKDNEISLLTLQNDQRFKLDELNRLYDQKDNKESNLKMMDSKNKQKDLKTLKSTLLEENERLLQSMNENESFPFGKDEALIVLSTLDSIVYKILDIMSLSPKDEIKTYMKYLDQDVRSVMKKKVSILDNRIAVINMTLENIKINQDKLPSYSISFNCNDDKTCPYVSFYQSVTSYHESDKMKLEKELSDLESKRTFYVNVSSIDEIISYIKYLLETINKIIIGSKFEKVITIDLIYLCMNNKSTDSIDIVTKEIRKYVTSLESKLEFDKNVETLSLVDKELDILEKHSITFESFKKEINDIYNQINHLTDEIELLRSTIESTSVTLNDDLLELSKLQLDLKNVESMDEYIKQLEAYNKEYYSYIEMKDKHKELSESIQTLKSQLYHIDKDIMKCKHEYDHLKHNIKEYKIIQKDLLSLNDSYDELDIIRESLSSSKGIPLLYIQLYMRSSKKFINELLDIVYKGAFRVETFIVNEKEFRIPYSKNGIVIDDIMYASDGERAFVSLITSLALLKQSIKKYNILLLDEVDGALDSESRSKFLDILEHYIQVIDCQQLFMITHNNAFDNYDIDLIVTGKTESIDNLKRANIIFKKE